MASTGYYSGQFIAPFLTIPPTGGGSHLRFGEFHRMEQGRAIESYIFLDLPELMIACGCCSISESPGQHRGYTAYLLGPARQDGLIWSESDQDRSSSSYALVTDMLRNLATADEAWRPFWHDHMLWYGPAAFGSFVGIEEFASFQVPFEGAFSEWIGGAVEVSRTRHFARFADADFVCSGEWPSLNMLQVKPFLGQQPLEKRLYMRVCDWWRREGHLAAASSDDVACILSKRCAKNLDWRGVHPFHEQVGVGAAAEAFWKPFLLAFSCTQRRQDIFFAGDNVLPTGGLWVVSMGHLMGLFDQPFLGIPPTRKIAMVRYAEFNRVENGSITATAFFPDLLHLMRQAGLSPLPDQTAAHLVQPGPETHDGLLLDDAEPGTGRATLDLIERMIGDISRNSNDGSGKAPYDATPQQELARCWHDDMIWWGPEGIGATYSIERYIEQHQRPFRSFLTNRTFNGHVSRVAEGHYGGFFGWANLTLTSTGGYLGVLPEGTVGDMRVVDLYRRDGDKLAENWVFIDMLHFLNMQGIDLLGRISGDQ